MRWRVFTAPRSRLPAIVIAAAAVIAVTLPAAEQLSPWFHSLFLAGYDSISKLQELPIGAEAHLRGVVTYADSAAKRFWIQDDTGAIAINQDPQSYGIHVGQSVRAIGTKTRPYNPLMGVSSVGLRDVKVTPAKIHLNLPSPAPASLRSLPDKERTGMLVQLSGVVRRVTHDRLGRVELAFGDAREEVPATLAAAQGDTSQWVNAKVRIAGIGEVIYDENRRVLNKYIWIPGRSDIKNSSHGMQRMFPFFSRSFPRYKR